LIVALAIGGFALAVYYCHQLAKEYERTHLDTVGIHAQMKFDALGCETNKDADEYTYYIVHPEREKPNTFYNMGFCVPLKEGQQVYILLLHFACFFSTNDCVKPNGSPLSELRRDLSFWRKYDEIECLWVNKGWVSKLR
jgi:hypothetical protein